MESEKRIPKIKSLKSAIILIDNLLYSRTKFTRLSLSERLEEEELSGTESTITRLLQFIDLEFGIKIKVDRTSFCFKIDKEETLTNYLEKYYKYKNLYFRNLLQTSTLEKNIIHQYVSFGFTTLNENVELLNPLLSAILENRKVRLEYLPFYENKPSTYTVCPLFLKEYLNRWYLITEKLENRHPIFAIDRIKNHEILKGTFIRKDEINSDTFKNTIGLFFSGPVEKVKLWVSKRQYPYFETLPFHSSQKMEEKTQDGCIISFEVTLNYELKQWILFYGSAIKVLEPESLKKEIIDELKNNLVQYKN